ncbi:hypothetical protein V8F06_010396 [Rhypophila decipiens]
MGSIPDTTAWEALPDASSSSLIVTQPTNKERLHVWTMTHPKWGAALTLDNYLGREAYLQTVPLAKEGGLTQWILTDGSMRPDERPILSSCESLKKGAIAALSSSSSSEPKEVVVVDGIAHGIASVFTEPQFRGKGYASRMMREVGKALERWQAETSLPDQRALFSVLYSDIGKSFYAKNGWAPFPSAHVSFSPASGAAAADTGKKLAKPIGYHELAELCNADEARLREEIKEAVVVSGGKKSAAAILPSLEQLLWHMMREDYMTKHIFGRTPSVRGAVYGEEKGKRMWAIWSRGYYGGLETIKGNTFHILRFVVEDNHAEQSELVDGFRSIIQLARSEAAEWRSEDIQMWNPGPLARGLIETSGVQHRIVEREEDSIPSLMWYGEGQLDEWVANEKYAWC